MKAVLLALAVAACLPTASAHYWYEAADRVTVEVMWDKCTSYEDPLAVAGEPERLEYVVVAPNGDVGAVSAECGVWVQPMLAPTPVQGEWFLKPSGKASVPDFHFRVQGSAIVQTVEDVGRYGAAFTWDGGQETSTLAAYRYVDGDKAVPSPWGLLPEP